MKKFINRVEWSTPILFLAILLGTFMCFNPPLSPGFPYIFPVALIAL
jgi:hypothetical protein